MATGVVEEFSGGYYWVCTVGGMLSAATTHLAVTPLDVLKVNMQINPTKYTGISSGFASLWREQGPNALWRGWSGKFFGYGVQGGCKFGLYEYFKKFYAGILGDQNRSCVFFLSSASAQVFADVALCPFEAIKVKVQTQPDFAKGLIDGFPKLYASEGLRGFYKGLFPLWGRNLPCYAAGAVGTVISNPADNIVSSLYNKKAETIMQAAKNIGLMNLFTRSLPVRITIVGPVISLQWFFYDSIKVLSGMPTSGGLISRHQEDKDLQGYSQC